MTADGLRKWHRRQLLIFASSSQALVLLLLFLSSYLPLFDSSPWTVLDKSTTLWATSSLLRWDVFHLGFAAEERMYEHQWAFFPGVPNLIKFLGQITSNDSWATFLQGSTLLATALDSTLVLYELGLCHLKSPSLSFLSATLSLLPSSPATLRHAPYAEPFFTWASYRGMLACAKSQWGRGSLYFCLAGIFRSNGVLLSGFILWGMLVEPFLTERILAIKRVPYALLLTSLIFSPAIYHQYSGYQVFCQETDTPAPWCSNFPPSIYTYVQSKYWNVGFLRYWTPQQIPNFLLAAPVLALLSYYSVQSVCSFAGRLFDKAQPRNLPAPESQSLAPHSIHAFIFTSILLFASHTQIILRFASSLPFTYWSAARLLIDHPRLATVEYVTSGSHPHLDPEVQSGNTRGHIVLRPSSFHGFQYPVFVLEVLLSAILVVYASIALSYALHYYMKSWHSATYHTHDKPTQHQYNPLYIDHHEA
ncbi:hypothetical protein BDM02DRAFT_3185046 [Thelephora ganbajun]|uniref:Uncharacterized protein n=1 Tax=Thelephora ganbajun TaxID=370292 RepID=A0ACB6ZMR6_THEGA|nr:hypothetical protein BDM02DRAFT_3185046 [Thelephora ganbajun]